MDPAVRSIQIASTLTERIAVLMSPPKTVGRSLGQLFVGTEPQADDLALRLGEAQQTVPEIWRHLDEARAGCAAAGLDVSTFDHIRAGQSPVTLASTNIQVEQRFDWLALEHQQIKTVTWDRAGFVRALAACAALKQLRSDVDWKALEREQAAEIAAAGSLSTQRWRRFAMWVAIAATLVGVAIGIRALVMSHPASDPQLERAQARDAEFADLRAKRTARIHELEQLVAKTRCDKDSLEELRRLLVLDGKLDRADYYESTITACP